MKFFSALLKPSILFAFLTICIVEMPSSVQSQTPAFLSVIDDLPLMPGLREDTDRALSFDTPNGRIAEITASGHVKAGGVIDYYARTLPQLGWQLLTLDRYMREDEVLNIDIAKSNEDSVHLFVHFRLSPAQTK
jgi:hypothetical protein